jgi:predicted peptidase
MAAGAAGSRKFSSCSISKTGKEVRMAKSRKIIILIVALVAIFDLALWYFHIRGKKDIQAFQEAEISTETVVGQVTAKQLLSEKTASSQSQTVTQGSTYYRDFLLDNVLHTKNNGDIHYNLYVPKSYEKSRKKYALYVTLPGYQGLYFQGVGQNIMTEDFGFEAMKYNSRMIILAPQLSDWEETSADQTIALVKYFLKNYRIDSSKVYISGYSGGGETLSLVLGKNPGLFQRALLCSSQWDGKYAPVVKSKTPVYLVVGESDEYYGSKPFQNAYSKLYRQYRKKGYTKKQISRRLVLDVKDASYFEDGSVSNQHGGGAGLFSKDEAIMGWLFQ